MLPPKRILVSWYTGLAQVRPFRLSDRQVTVGPKFRPDQPLEPFDGFTPRGRFDLYSALQSQKLPTDYDGIVVVTNPSGNNEPINLDMFDCPKILCVGDSHHLATPLRKTIDYAKLARYDFIALIYNRHHVHWFTDAGFQNVAWLPGLVPNVSRPFSTDRRPEMIFCGNSEQYHVRRNHLLLHLNSRKPFPLVLLKGRPDTCADGYASSTISLNCSLNGDLNLRVFEILAAGGCLLTDRLSQQAGLDVLVTEGKEYIGYDSVEECIEQARFLFNHPDIALSIARSGYDVFNVLLRPEQRAKQLLDWVFHGRLDSSFRVGIGAGNGDDVPLMDRIHLYENLQELHRSILTPSVLFMNDVPDIHILDALDLRHLRITIADAEEGATRVRPHEILERCRTVSPQCIGLSSWDYVVNQDVKVPQIYQALSFHQLGQLSEADSLYRQILVQNPENANAIHLLGILEGQRGRLSAAVELIDRAITINPTNPVFLFNRGTALGQLKRFDEALANYDRALAIKPDYVEAHCKRGDVLQELKRFDDALASYDRALLLKPDFAEALNNRGNAFKALNLLNEALASYERALKLKPDFAEALNNRDHALRALNRLDATLEGKMAVFRIEAAGHSLQCYAFRTATSRQIFKQILKGHTYPQVPFIGDVRTVLDIGANVGAASLYFALQYPKAVVYALEPAAEPFRVLTRNAAQLSNIRPYNIGLLNDDKTVPLYHGSFDSVTSSIASSVFNTQESELITLRRADKWLAEVGIDEIDILKIDTEGCEVAILQTIEGQARNSKVIYVEYHSEQDRQVIDRMLTSSHLLFSGRAHHPHRGEFCYVNRASFPSPEDMDRHKIHSVA